MQARGVLDSQHDPSHQAFDRAKGLQVGKFDFDFVKPSVTIQMQLPGLSLMAHALGKGQFSFDFISIHLTLQTAI